MPIGMSVTSSILTTAMRSGMPVTSVRWSWQSGWQPFVRAVYGNIDGQDLRLRYPLVNRFTVEGVDVLMKHIGGYPGKYDPSIRGTLLVHPPKLFISGHSHILKVKYDKTLGLLHINPGAAGIYGFHKVRTLVRLTLEAGTFKDMEVVELAEEGRK